MIQEKDFLYRVPVKNALVTAPGKQVRNPEILVDLEGGEFMHGDILDANSTNKLIDQSVKDAIDNSIENGNYVTKDLLEAETSARTKSDEDLSAKIKAEQTRAEGKEKEISDYYEKLYEKFPNVPKADIRRIVNYGWRLIYILTLSGIDIKLNNSNFFFLIGPLFKNSLLHFRNYVRKLKQKVIFLY